MAASIHFRLCARKSNDNQSTSTITDFSFPKQVGIYIRDVHTYPILTTNPSFQWSSTGEIGVALDFNLQVASNDYFFNLSREYNP